MGKFQRAENSSGLRRDVLSFFGVDKRSGLRGTYGLARPSLGKDHVPEVVLRVREADTNESPLLLFTDGGHEAVHGLRSHLIEKAHHLTWQQRGIHHDESTVRAYKLCKRTQIDGFAFRHLTSYLQWYLESYSDCATSFRVSGPMHLSALEEDATHKACHG